MHQNINALFKQWHRVIKIYRNGGSANLESNDGDSSNGQQSDNDALLVSAAHFDVLAECITKLIGSKPEWLTKELGADNIRKQDLIDATFFVDYDKIDVVQQEEEDSQQIMMGGDDQGDQSEET